MLETVVQIGELFGKNKPYDLIEGDYILSLNLSKEGKFLNLELEEFTEEKIVKLFFKKASGSNPPSFTPTMHLNLKEPSKTLKMSLKNLETLAKYGNFPLPFLQELLKDKILRELSEKIEGKIKNLPTNSKIILTIKINSKYLGEIPELIEGLKKFEEHYLKEKVKSKEGVCSICGVNKKVYGEKILPFKFYTLDKPGFIHGGFKEKTFVFPICYDCNLKLKEGWDFINSNLKFSLAGNIEFLLIPELILEDKGKLKWLIEKRLIKTVEKVGNLSETAKEKLAQDERRVLKKISEEGNYFTVHLMFIEKKQNEEKIKLHIYGIYPSRLKELFEFKEFIDRLLSINFNYFIVWNFFNNEHKQVFYDYIYSTFTGGKIDNSFLLSLLLQNLKRSLEVEKNLRIFSRNTSEALGIYLFSMLTSGGLNMTSSSSECLQQASNLEEFLNCLPLLKEGEFPKGIFLLGVLTGRLLKIQEIRLNGNKPFLRKLKGFKLKKRDFQSLYTDLVNKFYEYDQNSDYKILSGAVKELLKKVSEYLLATEQSKLSDKEANFIFASGIGLSEKVFELLNKTRKAENKNVEGQE